VQSKGQHPSISRFVPLAWILKAHPSISRAGKIANPGQECFSRGSGRPIRFRGLGGCKQKHSQCQNGIDETLNQDLTGLRRRLAGTSIADGWRGLLVGTKADGKMRVQMNRFPRYYKCVFMCEGCFATQDYKRAEKVLSYGNLLDSAPWRLTMLSHRAYMLSDGPKSPWSAVHGWSLEMVWRDLMHSLYQGTGQDLVASLCVDLYITGDLAADDSTAAFRALFLDLRDWCKAHQIAPPVKKLTPAALGVASKANTFPSLSSEYKAVHVKVRSICHFS
jgi:hypothetical protein